MIYSSKAEYIYIIIIKEHSLTHNLVFVYNRIDGNHHGNHHW
jgi:hypothetical protein